MHDSLSEEKNRIRAPSQATTLWILLLLALALRLVVVALTNGAGFDIVSYGIQAQSVLAHHNIYTFTDRYPYPPVWVWIVGLLKWVANTTGLSFGRLARFPGIVGDVGIVALLQRCKGNRAALFYAMNPVSILITAGHGQFDGLVMALVVAAWALWDTQQQRHHNAWAALALGGAIALKGYPVLLLPALLMGAGSYKRRAVLIALAFAPLLLAMLVYSAFFGFEPAMLTHVLGYQSPAILGWGLYIDKLFPQLALLLGWPARVAVLLLPVLLALWKPRWPLAFHWLATFLGFYVLAPGISPQYLLWVLPLLALVDLKRGLFYTAFATPTLIFVYLADFPSAVPGGLNLSATAPFYIWLLCYWIVNLAWWLVCLRLLYQILRKEEMLLNLNDNYQGSSILQDKPVLPMLFEGIKERVSDRHGSSHNSIPESASQQETDEKQAES